MLHKIRPELVHLLTPVDQVQPWPGNPRQGDLELIGETLDLYGQYQPIIAQASSKRIIIGNNRYLAATRRGWTHMAVSLLDVDDDTARRMLAADNKASDKGTYDDADLAEYLAGLADLTGTGWSVTDLTNLSDQLTGSADETPAHVPAPAPATSAGTLPPAAPATPASAAPAREMVMVMTEQARDEATWLITDCRAALHEDLTTAQVILRALRMLLIVLDHRDHPGELTPATLLQNAKDAR